LIIDRITLKSNAHQKFLTSKPDTKKSVNCINNAFITKVNKPKVKIFIGKVNIISIGLIMALIKPKAKAVSSNSDSESIYQPFYN